MHQALKLELLGQSLSFVLPELVLCLGLVLLIMVGLFVRNGMALYGLALGVAVVNALVWQVEQSPVGVRLFNGMLWLDSFNYSVRGLVAVAGILTLLICNPNTIKRHQAEFYTLLLTMVLGAQLLAMSHHMVSLLLALELVSIPGYVLAGFGFTRSSAEAAFKYFVYGAVATATMLFGMSWLYGLGGTLEFSSGLVDKLGYHNHIVLFVMSVLVLAAVLFKMAAFPFYIWTPDVYEAAPISVVAILSTIPKVAAGAVFLKLIAWLSLDGFSRYNWISVASVMSIITLLVGNFSALWQTNIKRLMAYSSVSQAGFLMAAAIVRDNQRSIVFGFYALVLTLSTVLVFLMLQYFEKLKPIEKLQHLAGFGRTHPLASVLLSVGLISLTGLPITAGFTAKLLLFSATLEAWQLQSNLSLLILFGIGLLTTVVALFYYLKMPYQLFLKEPQAETTSNAVPQPGTLLLGVILGAAIIALFIWPEWVTKFLSH